MATTAEQLAQAQAEELARLREEKARRDAAEKAQQDEERKGWFNKITGLFGDFSLSSLLMWGVVLFAAYSIAKSEWGQDLIQKVVGNFEPDTQATILGMFGKVGIDMDMYDAFDKMSIDQVKDTLKKADVSPEVIGVLAKDKDTFMQFCKDVRNANKDGDKLGKVNESTFTNDKTLFALLNNPARAGMVQQLADAAFKNGNDPKNKMTQQLMGSFKAIVESDRLDVLFDKNNRENTTLLLSKIANVPLAQVQALVKTGVADDGKVKPEFRTFLSNALGGASNSTSQATQPGQNAGAAAALDKYAGADKATATTLVNAAIAAAQAAGDKADDSQKMILNNGGKAFAAMRAALNDDSKLVAAATVLAGNDDLAKLKFALENRKAFDAYTKAANRAALPKAINEQLTQLESIPAAATDTVLAMIKEGGNPLALQKTFMPKGVALTGNALLAELMIPESRALIRANGVKNVATLMALMSTDKNSLAAKTSAKTLDAALTALDTVQANAAGKNESVQENTESVTLALAAKLLLKNDAALKKIRSQDFADFFADPVNAKAMQTLLSDAEFPKAEADVAKALLAHWKTVKELSADKTNGGARVVLDAIKDMGNTAPSCSSILPSVPSWNEFKLWVKSDDTEDLKALKFDIQNAQCAAIAGAVPQTQTSQAAPTPAAPITPAGRSYAPGRVHNPSPRV